MVKKSFYDLAFGVAPGGARKDAHYILDSLDDVKAALADELAEETNLYLLCWYGADLSLHVYQQGELAQSIDLHPFVTISIKGYPDITFSGPGEPIGYDFRADDGAGDEEEGLSSKMFYGSLGDAVGVSVDWSRIEVPLLSGELVADDDEDDAFELVDGNLASYGYQDFEE
ncbi:hypothetical protein [Embleya scabrispora]|uniref:hypothetical protein n=1 Tax=Embleya scabrispora TaxID=159449 RepID=UPI0005928650|nr:hypothetical protein [Embleya scabrispora]MYS86601.1 hypothetical protein [Streptomyces sp. SID5474]